MPDENNQGNEEAGDQQNEKKPYEGQLSEDKTEIYTCGEWRPTTTEVNIKEKKAKSVGEPIEGELKFGRNTINIIVQPMKFTQGKSERAGYNVKIKPNQYFYGAGNYYVRQPKFE